MILTDAELLALVTDTLDVLGAAHNGHSRDCALWPNHPCDCGADPHNAMLDELAARFEALEAKLEAAPAEVALPKISDERCRGLICALCGGPVDQYGPHNYLPPNSPWHQDYVIQVGFAQIAIFDKAKSTEYPVAFKDDLSRPEHFACWSHRRVYGRVEPFGSNKGHRAWT